MGKYLASKVHIGIMPRSDILFGFFESRFILGLYLATIRRKSEEPNDILIHFLYTVTKVIPNTARYLEGESIFS
jgi:hypothetical protein